MPDRPTTPGHPATGRRDGAARCPVVVDSFFRRNRAGFRSFLERAFATDRSPATAGTTGFRPLAVGAHMRPAFTDDDVDKRVETADGEPIGVVAMTDADTAYVDLESSAVDSIRAALDWDGDSDEVVPIDVDDVRDVDSRVIRLERDVSAGSAANVDETDPVFERDETTGHGGTEDEGHAVDAQSGEGSTTDEETAAAGEGRSGKGLEPETDEMTEAGAERHPDGEENPPQGDRTVTKDRAEEEDR